MHKFSPDGELLMTLGTPGEAGDPPTRLSEPTDVAIAPDGDVFITEGHSFSAGVNRVSKFRADGSFVASWGSTGSGPGEFNVPHTIALDARGRVFVGEQPQVLPREAHVATTESSRRFVTAQRGSGA